MISLVGVSLIYFLNTQLVRKARVIATDKKKRRSKSVLEAVYALVLNDIRIKVAEQRNCSLDRMIVPGSLDYIKTRPKVFPKEQIYLEDFDATNKPTGRFEAPETNARAWIEKAPGTNPGLYLIIVNTEVCPRIVGSRNYLSVPDSTDPKIDTPEKVITDKISRLLSSPRPVGEATVSEIPWATPCPLNPGESLKFVEYRAFFDTRSLASDYVMYIDRSELANTSMEEPSHDEEYDLESQIATSEVSGIVGDSAFQPAATTVGGTGGVRRRRTGSNDEGTVARCSVRIKSVVENAIDSILIADPCARIKAYMVGGTTNSTVPIPPNNITCLGPATVCSNQIGAKGWDISTERAQILQTLLGTADASTNGGNAGICRYRPSGRTSLIDILAHYKRNYQPTIDSIEDASRSLKRVLMVVGDGVQMGGDSTVDGESMIPAQSQPISGAGPAKKLSDLIYLDVFSSSNCSSNGGLPASAAEYFVEGMGFPKTLGSAAPAFDGLSIIAGDKIFKATTSAATAVASRRFRRRVPPQPVSSIVVRSVVRLEDGVCIDILVDNAGVDDYAVPNYPYYVISPVRVENVSGNVRNALESYDPYLAYQQAVSRSISSTMNPDLRNGLAYFPMPRADLDETPIYSPTPAASSRQLFLSLIQLDNVTSSYSSYLRGIENESAALPEGFSVFGVTSDSAR